MRMQVAVLVLLALTAAAHRALIHSQSDVVGTATATAAALPPRILNFRQAGPDVEIAPYVKAQLETSDVLVRKYLSPRGVPVELTIVNTGATRRSLHFPEVCITGAGWEIREQYYAPVGVLFVGKRLVVFKGNEEEAVIYWFKTGDRFTGNFFTNTFNWLRGQILLESPNSMMIRVSAPIGAGGVNATFRVLDDFACGLAPLLLEHFN